MGSFQFAQPNFVRNTEKLPIAIALMNKNV